ncbi:ATP-binding protein [Nocardiopsis trehalosi]|uniref:ATP-binding protein n=1 Tax=Nocardiopsis trehalosi TaxID=109329 RepID=UPI00082A925E|nr:ATP-binding protein [Nocardiopsis trehalosi]
MTAGAERTAANPYRLVGQVAGGDRFVGRADLVERVQRTWRDPRRPMNLRIVGHHRVGKTSLVRQAVRTCPADRDDLVHVWLNVGSYEAGTDLFRVLSRRLLQRLPQRRRDAVGPLDEVIQTAPEWYRLNEAVRDLLRVLREDGTYVLLVLDEFDRASVTFSGLAQFQLLRDLASDDEYPLGLVTVSRRHIEKIETDTAGGSILGGVVPDTCHVGMFTDPEVDELLARGAAAGADLAPLRGAILERTGAHPFLLELLCNRLVDRHLAGDLLDVGDAYRREEHAIAGYFDRMLRTIADDLGPRGVAVLRRVAEGAGPVPESRELAWLAHTGVVLRRGERAALFSPAFGRAVLAAAGPDPG